MTARTTLKVSSDTRDRLRAAKVGGESYEDVINRLLNTMQDSKEVTVEH